MTKEEYLELRNSNKFSLDLLWEYYCNKVEEKDRKVKSFDEFVPLYMDYTKIAGFYSIELAQEYFDEKFKINKLIDTKENKIIKYV